MSGLECRLDGETEKRSEGLPIWKRALDLALTIVSSPVWLSVGLVAGLVVKCGSGGPVFFRQKRIGYRGESFTLFKFRTMAVNADTSQHRDYARRLVSSQAPMTKLDARPDAGLVPFGSLMRATGIDELPQLLNVLRGEMSLVGPRPCIPYEYELYEPWQRRRTEAVPGLTGLWQVSGKNRTTFVEMIELDLEYARRKSLGLDLRIILKTLPALWQQCRDARAQRRREAATAVPRIGNSIESFNL